MAFTWPPPSGAPKKTVDALPLIGGAAFSLGSTLGGTVSRVSAAVLNISGTFEDRVANSFEILPNYDVSISAELDFSALAVLAQLGITKVTYRATVSGYANDDAAAAGECEDMWFFGSMGVPRSLNTAPTNITNSLVDGTGGTPGDTYSGPNPATGSMIREVVEGSITDGEELLEPIMFVSARGIADCITTVYAIDTTITFEELVFEGYDYSHVSRFWTGFNVSAERDL